MQLQISTYRYDGDRADMQGSGHVYVSGGGVTAYFHFGAVHGVDQAGAERQAEMFMASGTLLYALRELLDLVEDHRGSYLPKAPFMALSDARNAIAMAEGRA